MTATMTYDPTRDVERNFVGNYQRSMLHFYCVGHEQGVGRYAYGYMTPDGVFHQGIVGYNFDTGYFEEEVVQ